MLGVVIHAPKDLRRDKVKPVVEKYAGDIGEDLMNLRVRISQRSSSPNRQPA
jgi:hypothetical protein